MGDPMVWRVGRITVWVVAVVLLVVFVSQRAPGLVPILPVGVFWWARHDPWLGHREPSFEEEWRFLSRGHW